MLGSMRRVIFFAHDMNVMTAFYRDTLELTIHTEGDFSPDEWVEFDAGGCRIALHKSHDPQGQAATWHKIVFHVEDVEQVRETLIQRGVRMDEIMAWDDVKACDGVDPEGNRFQIINQ